MGWLQKSESKLYPGYFEYGGSYLDASHVLVVTEGRFFKIDDGYVLLAICARITGFKEPVETETKFALEIHNKDYERWLGKVDGNKKFSPNWYELALIEWLESNPFTLEKSFAGSFKFMTGESPAMDFNEAGSVEEWFAKRLKWFEPTGKIEFKLGSKNANFTKGSGQSEYQKLQDRTNWLYDQYCSLVGIKREGDANLVLIAGLAATIHGAEQEDAYQSLQWNLICQITGIVIPPPKIDRKF